MRAFALRGRGVLPHHVACRIAHVLEQRERTDPDDQQHEDGLGDSAENERQHRGQKYS